ncbi:MULTISPECIES: TrmH family RNA methyltransferase [Veillonella]|uniref:TrmH family RNA methyltransferase n=1 Tax=Veillonella TaxID=29465 RepID=UPI00196204FF|nr:MULTISPECIES: RNA methyltransferase [Veillonella]MDU2068408.1 RNA methyltransferase [Veillonella sp.]MDU2580520.1 RNA methyltransferase [Veillonella sp.]MDU2971068.1 RNA methyltransferase [Veillonella sp.]MDU3280758.1 RNA methyltransferase [Veillonella sp.]VTY43370.1 Putative TrmH family tRNA/rRNA methyltransferase [Veillonella atypica]
MESPKIDYIQSKDNKTIKHIISLQQRKYRQKFGEYMVEGIRAVTDIGKKDCLRSILIRESKRSELEPLVEKGFTVSSVYVVQDPIFDKIEHSVNGQGILGIAKKCVNDLHSLIVEDGLYVALDGVQDPGNLGTIIRTAVAAGAKGIFLLKGTVDPYNEKCVRSTMSALCNIPIFEDVTLSEFYDFIKDNTIKTYVTSLENAKPYHTISYAKRTMIILGNEGNGVSREIIEMCDQAITIPMYGDIESLNVSIAAALCMYKVREQI